MLANEVRQKYIEFFQERGHLYLPSAPLRPVDVLGRPDKTTLFTGSGMQQFKPYFTGEAVPPSPRVLTVQKCLRTVDIDAVGDMQHCTFFEMLGNFSFGDYFKAEVIPWTWEFLTQVIGLDSDRFSVTVYLDDDEAYDIWRNVVGLPDERIHRLGEDKNYWPANSISEVIEGPCGPCSEIFYRLVPLEEMTTNPSLTPTERYKIDDDAGRYVEVWNNVFTQFNLSKGDGGEAVLTPLPKKNNDTGAGFDRIVMVKQGKRSVFETDLFGPTLQHISEMAGEPYGGTMSPTDFAMRVVAEHTRSMIFCIADGILPGNSGAEYQLRYVMRRAVRYGKTVLGFEEPFLHLVAPRLIEQMGGFYTELQEKRDLILQTVQREERQFRETLDKGMVLVERLLQSPEVQDSKLISGEDAFDLYQTYGFPLGLTKDIAAEQGVEVDEAGYEAAEARHRGISGGGPREVWQTGDGQRVELPPTSFVGYDGVSEEANVIALLQNKQPVDSARAGDEVTVILDRTPFYAEAGGQVGDMGWIVAPPGDTTCALRIEVTDTQKVAGVYYHTAKVLEGEIHTGQTVRAQVEAERRRAIMRNHTTTHLLQAALREVLGGHVYQKGSLVGPDYLRFDFTHTQPISHDEVKRIEEIVNRHILADEPVVVHSDVPISEAKSRGAMALFGEKYGDTVRMIEIPGFSLELCGGTHLQRTSQAGLFKITSQSGVGSGVRRIEALTGAGAIQHMNSLERQIEQVAELLKSNPRDVLVAAEKLAKERSELQKEVLRLKSGAASGAADLATSDVSGIAVVTGALKDADVDALSALADRSAQQKGSVVVVLGGQSDGKVVFVAKVTPDLVKRGLHAGNLVREVAKVAGGGGGGRPDFAQAGGRDPDKLDEAIAKVAELVRAQAEG
jgi:alanyl-tRNA synthetase